MSHAAKYYWIRFSEKPLGETSSSMVKSITWRLVKCWILSPKSSILSISKLLPQSLRDSMVDGMFLISFRLMKLMSTPCIALNLIDRCFKLLSGVSRSLMNFYTASLASSTGTGAIWEQSS